MDPTFGKEFALDVARDAVKRGATAAEVIIKAQTEFSVGVRLGELETLQESSDQGFGLRVLIDGRQASVSGSDFSADAVSSLVDQAVEMARLTSPDDGAVLPSAEEFASSVADFDLYDDAVANLSTNEKIKLALAAEDAARSYDSRIVNFDGSGLESSVGFIVLANSVGFAGQASGTTCSITTVPVASDGDRMQRDYWWDRRRKMAMMDKPEEIGIKAAQRTLRKLGGRPVPTQTVPVVFDSVVARQILSDLFDAVSGDSIFRKASFFVGQLGEQVASDKLTVIDDGTIPCALGSRPFDAEGLPTKRTVVIAEGVLESFLLNTYTARKLGMKSTANATRNLVGAPSVGCGNLYIKPGPHSSQEIISSISNGLLVTELIGFGVNIVNGDYSRSASGIWIEKGELTFPVQGVTVAGNLKDMLRSIEMVGNDLDFRTNIASPTLLFGRMTIGA